MKHLFISNFRKLIRSNYWKIVIFAVVGCLYFSLILFLPANAEVGANQLQTNILKVQHYTFDMQECSYVIVGSSEAARIPAEKVDDNLYNLSISGGSALTGLKLISEKRNKPEIVFVEMNDTIIRGIDEELVKKTSWWNSMMINREKYRMDYLFRQLYQPLYVMIKEKSVPNEVATDKEMLQLNYEAYQELAEDKIFSESMCLVKKMIEELRQEGVRVILLEMPLDVKLYNTPYNIQVMEMFNKMFPESEYEWFKVPWQEYHTTDGIHLIEADAKKYAEQLKEMFFD